MYAQYKGIFIDFVSVPQWPRTEGDEAIFRKALSSMGSLYSSAESSTVLQCKIIPTPPADYDGTYSDRPYDSSGWCNFEQGAAQLVTGTEAVIKARLDLLREPVLLFKAYVAPVLLMLFSAVGGEAAVSQSFLRGERDLAAYDLIDRVNALTRPKLMDISDAHQSHIVALCAASPAPALCGSGKHGEALLTRHCMWVAGRDHQDPGNCGPESSSPTSLARPTAMSWSRCSWASQSSCNPSCVHLPATQTKIGLGRGRGLSTECLQLERRPPQPTCRHKGWAGRTLCLCWRWW